MFLFRIDVPLQPTCVLSHSSCVWLTATLWTVASQAPLSMGVFRQEYWGGLPCPPLGDLPDTGIKLLPLMFPALAGNTSSTWEAPLQPRKALIVHFLGCVKERWNRTIALGLRVLRKWQTWEASYPCLSTNYSIPIPSFFYPFPIPAHVSNPVVQFLVYVSCTNKWADTCVFSYTLLHEE